MLKLHEAVLFGFREPLILALPRIYSLNALDPVKAK
jgi:hypothetical protein